MKARILVVLALVLGLAFVVALVATAQEVELPALPNPLVTPTPTEVLPPIHVPYDPFKRLETLPEFPYNKLRPSRPRPQVLFTKPAGIDLDVTYINRTPMYKAYCVQYPGGIPIVCPGTENEKRWPSPGELVTFTAHIVNKGTATSPTFTYKWFIDGVEVASATHPGLAPEAEGTATYQWAWAHTMDGERVVDDHTVRFTVDPANVIAETYQTNNSLEDRTNALGFRIAITPEMYEAYNTPWNPAFSYSAEDWLQRQIVAMNWAFANSIYATTPQGATERVRINSIEVTSTDPVNDGTSDGGWFVNGDYRLISGGYDPITDIDWNLAHELSHQLGLIDLYNLNIAVTSVQVLDQTGIPANIGFSWPRWDLMVGGDIAPHADHHLYSSHSARGISSNKGYRRGYYGEYQYDIPQRNCLLVLDSQGNPARDVQVALYQRTGPTDWTGAPSVDNTPEMTGTTGSDGLLLLTNRSASGGITTRTAHTLRDNLFGVVDVVGGQNRFLLKLSKGDHEEFGWLDITAFNLAYWQGDVYSHTFTITSHVPPPDAPARPEAGSVQPEGDRATLCWSASRSVEVAGYYVYRAAPPTYAYERASSLVTGRCYSETYGSGNRVYAVTAMDSSGRESGFSSFLWASRLINPYAVGISSDGTRIILDPQNGYALLRQQSDGRYIQNFGSPHYHLEFSHFLVLDQLERMIISHPGDYYTSRHSVRVADHDANPILEFGERGPGPGQFETPAGVAIWGQPCTIEGPHSVDAHTLLLLHFDGSYNGEQGESGTPSGTTFAAGRYAHGVEIDDSDTLTYATAGNLNRTQGAIEFWVRPNWDGGDFRNYSFFDAADSWYNAMRIVKDGANNLRFIVWSSTSEHGVAHNVAHWRAGEWHHLAVTWEGTDIALYVDGQQRDSRSDATLPDVLASVMRIGCYTGNDRQINAVIDEFRISDIARVGNSDTCAYRILVADSGNHRIQAFDGGGNFVSAYGSLGNGPGQFNNPQGLAVDGNGRVIVADSGNNRLQVLSFDGTSFGFIRSITANFNGPTGVAAYGTNRIIVADTGNNKVKVLNTDGNLLAEHSAPNDGYTGTFNRPRDVIGDMLGNIVVADTGNRRVVTVIGALPPLMPTETLTPTPTPTDTSTPTPTATATPALTNTPTRTPTATPTPTPTNMPAVCTIQGKITLQGRPTPPNEHWIVLLRVTVGSTNYTVTTDPSGSFTVTGLTPGTYDICAKNSHTLSSRRSGVTLVAGANSLDFGTLREGDANNDDYITIIDFSALAAGFLPAYDPRADFNQDGYVNINDFSLLALNFGAHGACVPNGSQPLVRVRRK